MAYTLHRKVIFFFFMQRGAQIKKWNSFAYECQNIGQHLNVYTRSFPFGKNFIQLEDIFYFKQPPRGFN